MVFPRTTCSEVFYKGWFLETNLIFYSKFLLSNLDNQIQVDTAYTDFSNAFDVNF